MNFPFASQHIYWFLSKGLQYRLRKMTTIQLYRIVRWSSYKMYKIDCGNPWYIIEHYKFSILWYPHLLFAQLHRMDFWNVDIKPRYGGACNADPFYGIFCRWRIQNVCGNNANIRHVPSCESNACHSISKMTLIVVISTYNKLYAIYISKGNPAKRCISTISWQSWIEQKIQCIYLINKDDAQQHSTRFIIYSQ